MYIEDGNLDIKVDIDDQGRLEFVDGQGDCFVAGESRLFVRLGLFDGVES